ncbi:MAG TPA: OmpA family protein, partial [bacterium]|nr:OmpA family protein [bacterium]
VPVMQGNAGYINQHGDLQVTIEGHCDNRGSNEYNLALGHRRAQSAANYLMNLGVDGGRLRIVSFGEERPVCQYDNEDCWQRNRRADFRKQ